MPWETFEFSPEIENPWAAKTEVASLTPPTAPLMPNMTEVPKSQYTAEEIARIQAQKPAPGKTYMGALSEFPMKPEEMEVKPPKSSQFGLGINRGLLTAQELMGGALTQVGESTGLRGVKDAGGVLRDFARSDTAAMPQPRVDSLGKIENLNDFGDWFATKLGEGLATSAPMIGLGATTGLPGALLGGWGLGVGEVRNELEDVGVKDPELLAKYSYIAGSVVGALDTIVPAQFLNALTGNLKPELGKYLIKRLAVASAEGAAKEGITEALQEATTIAAVAAAQGPQVAQEMIARGLAGIYEQRGRILEAGAAGAVPGSVFGGGGQVASEVHRVGGEMVDEYRERRARPEVLPPEPGTPAPLSFIDLIPGSDGSYSAGPAQGQISAPPRMIGGPSAATPESVAAVTPETIAAAPETLGALSSSPVSPRSFALGGPVASAVAEVTAKPLAQNEYLHGGTYQSGTPINGVMYLSKSPEYAGSYVNMAAERGMEGANVQRLSLPLTRAAPPELVERIAQKVGVETDGITPASWFDANIHGEGPVNRLVTQLRAAGFDHANLMDIPYGTGGAPAEVTVAFPKPGVSANSRSPITAAPGATSTPHGGISQAVTRPAKGALGFAKRLANQTLGKSVTIDNTAPNLDETIEAHLAAGRTVKFPEAFTDKILDIVRPHLGIVAKGVDVQMLMEIKPHNSENVMAVFKDTNGQLTEVAISFQKLRDSRAFFDHRTGDIFFTHFNLRAGYENSVVGELWHENIHALRLLNAFPAADWAALLNHANSLGVLDLDYRTLGKATKLPDYEIFDPNITIRQVYAEVMRDPNYMEYTASERKEVFDGEAVAHLMEIVAADGFKGNPLKPIQGILDNIANNVYKPNAGEKANVRYSAMKGPEKKSEKKVTLSMGAMGAISLTQLMRWDGVKLSGIQEIYSADEIWQDNGVVVGYLLDTDKGLKFLHADGLVVNATKEGFSSLALTGMEKPAVIKALEDILQPGRGEEGSVVAAALGNAQKPAAPAAPKKATLNAVPLEGNDLSVLEAWVKPYTTGHPKAKKPIVEATAFLDENQMVGVYAFENEDEDVHLFDVINKKVQPLSKAGLGKLFDSGMDAKIAQALSDLFGLKTNYSDTAQDAPSKSSNVKISSNPVPKNEISDFKNLNDEFKLDSEVKFADTILINGNFFGYNVVTKSGQSYILNLKGQYFVPKTKKGLQKLRSIAGDEIADAFDKYFAFEENWDETEGDSSFVEDPNSPPAPKELSWEGIPSSQLHQVVAKLKSLDLPGHSPFGFDKDLYTVVAADAISADGKFFGWIVDVDPGKPGQTDDVTYLYVAQGNLIVEITSQGLESLTPYLGKNWVNTLKNTFDFDEDIDLPSSLAPDDAEFSGDNALPDQKAKSQALSTKLVDMPAKLQSAILSSGAGQKAAINDLQDYIKDGTPVAVKVTWGKQLDPTYEVTEVFGLNGDKLWIDEIAQLESGGAVLEPSLYPPKGHAPEVLKQFADDLAALTKKHVPKKYQTEETKKAVLKKGDVELEEISLDEFYTGSTDLKPYQSFVSSEIKDVDKIYRLTIPGSDLGYSYIITHAPGINNNFKELKGIKLSSPEIVFISPKMYVYELSPESLDITGTKAGKDTQWAKDAYAQIIEELSAQGVGAAGPAQSEEYKQEALTQAKQALASAGIHLFQITEWAKDQGVKVKEELPLYLASIKLYLGTHSHSLSGKQKAALGEARDVLEAVNDGKPFSSKAEKEVNVNDMVSFSHFDASQHKDWLSHDFHLGTSKLVTTEKGQEFYDKLASIQKVFSNGQYLGAVLIPFEGPTQFMNAAGEFVPSFTKGDLLGYGKLTHGQAEQLKKNIPELKAGEKAVIMADKILGKGNHSKTKDFALDYWAPKAGVSVDMQKTNPAQFWAEIFKTYHEVYNNTETQAYIDLVPMLEAGSVKPPEISTVEELSGWINAIKDWNVRSFLLNILAADGQNATPPIIEKYAGDIYGAFPVPAFLKAAGSHLEAAQKTLENPAEDTKNIQAALKQLEGKIGENIEKNVAAYKAKKIKEKRLQELETLTKTAEEGLTPLASQLFKSLQDEKWLKKYAYSIEDPVEKFATAVSSYLDNNGKYIAASLVAQLRNAVDILRGDPEGTAAAAAPAPEPVEAPTPVAEPSYATVSDGLAELSSGAKMIVAGIIKETTAAQQPVLESMTAAEMTAHFSGPGWNKIVSDAIISHLADNEPGIDIPSASHYQLEKLAFGLVRKAPPTTLGELLSTPATDDPQKRNYTFVGKGSGGSKPKEIWKDDAGNEYMFKPVKPGDDFLAHGEVLGGQISRMVTPEAPEMFVMRLNKRLGSMQRYVRATGTLGELNLDIQDLTTKQISQIQREHVVDWMISNHDGHKNQFLVMPDGGLIGIDKGQAFKYFGKDKLDTDYHPNEVYGEHEPLYNTLWRAYSKGELKAYEAEIQKDERAQLAGMKQIIDDQKAKADKLEEDHIVAKDAYRSLEMRLQEGELSEDVQENEEVINAQMRLHGELEQIHEAAKSGYHAGQKAYGDFMTETLRFLVKDMLIAQVNAMNLWFQVNYPEATSLRDKLEEREKLLYANENEKSGFGRDYLALADQVQTLAKRSMDAASAGLSFDGFKDKEQYRFNEIDNFAGRLSAVALQDAYMLDPPGMPSRKRAQVLQHMAADAREQLSALQEQYTEFEKKLRNALFGEVVGTISKLQATLSDSLYASMLRPYAESRFKGNALKIQAFLDYALQRKNGLGDKFFHFFVSLDNIRERARAAMKIYDGTVNTGANVRSSTRILNEDLMKQDKMYAALTPPEWKAIHDYTNSAYRTINTPLYSEKVLKGGEINLNWLASAEYGALVMSGLKKIKPYFGEVYRREGLSDIKTQVDIFKIGQIAENKAFWSSTTNVSKNPDNQVNYYIKSKTGRDVKPLSGHPHEDEVLFMPGCRFLCTNLVVDDTGYGKKYIIYLTEMEDIDFNQLE